MNLNEYSAEFSNQLISQNIRSKASTFTVFNKFNKNRRTGGFDSFNSSSPDVAPSEKVTFYNSRKMMNFDAQTEIARLKIVVEKLKNNLTKYQSKYNGLFTFLEDCLMKFFNDINLEKNSTLKVNLDQIKKCDFTVFNHEEKYALLVLLMKRMLPLVTVNFNSCGNIGSDLFMTNINIINRNFNRTNNYFKEPFFEHALSVKSNKLQKMT